MDFRKFVDVCIEIEWSVPNFGKLRNRVMAWRGRDRDLKTAGAPRSVSMRTCGLRMPCCRIAERGQAITRGRHERHCQLNRIPLVSSAVTVSSSEIRGIPRPECCRRWSLGLVAQPIAPF
jgi:hypothetical protein